MTADDSLLDRLRDAVAGLRDSGETERNKPDEEDERVAPLERTLVEKQREKMDDVAEDLSED